MEIYNINDTFLSNENQIKSCLFIDFNVKLLYFINIPKRKIENKEMNVMINDEICKLRDKLNKSIIEGQDYEVIYKLSIELDELIAEYYKNLETNTVGVERS